jgi:hypothetical protein
MRGKATWREKIGHALKGNGETFDDVVAMVARVNQERFDGDDHPFFNVDGDGWLDLEFDDGYGGAEGCFFTVWTVARVYFPTEYDGAEEVNSVPRNPCDEATPHV